MSAPPSREQQALPFELQALDAAERYQGWMVDAVRPFLGRRTLEIGAGIGNLSRRLPAGERLIASEPDEALLAVLRERMADRLADAGRVSAIRFDPTRDPLDPLVGEDLDTVVSFNVIEHIADDAGALGALAEILLRGSGPWPRHLVSFVPAHMWAYGSLDREFGHHRRYTRSGMRRLLAGIAPGGTVSARYFNLFGLPGWVVSGRLLRQRRIAPGAVRAVEALTPALRRVDDLLQTRLRFPAGQSLIGVVRWDR